MFKSLHFNNHGLLSPKIIKRFCHIFRNNNRRDRRNKGKIGRRELMVVKKIVNRFTGRLSTFAKGNGPTRVIMIRSCDIIIRWWMRRTCWRGLPLGYCTSHSIPALIGNERWCNGSKGFCMVFWVSRAEGTKDSIKDIVKTCWTKLKSYVERGNKGAGSKKVTLINI